MRIPALALTVIAAAACTHHARPDSFVRLERTACLERCPQYRVTMYAGGDVVAAALSVLEPAAANP